MNTLNTSNRSLHNARPVVHRVADGVGRQSGVDVRMTVERMMGICCGEERERTKLERMNYFLEKENFENNFNNKFEKWFETRNAS